MVNNDKLCFWVKGAGSEGDIGTTVIYGPDGIDEQLIGATNGPRTFRRDGGSAR